jgi:hypothetical protein
MSKTVNLRIHWCKKCGTKNSGSLLTDACIGCNSVGTLSIEKPEPKNRIQEVCGLAVEPHSGNYQYQSYGGGKIPSHPEVAMH